MINGKANCVSTIYAQPQFYLEETNYSNWDNSSENFSEHHWQNGTVRQWREITERIRFRFINTNITFVITDGQDLITLTPYVVTASGQRRSFNWLRNNFPQFRPNFEIFRRKGSWKWGFNATIPSNLSIPQALGFQIAGCNRGCGYGNGTLYFMGKELDLRPMFRDGWRFTLRNSTALEFTNDRQFGNRTIEIDPYVQLNSNTTGSLSRTLNINSTPAYEQLAVASSILLGRDVASLSDDCGFFSKGYCKGYLTFNVSQIPKNVQIESINLSVKTNGGSVDTGDSFDFVLTRASPYYNNDTNASNFFEYNEIGSGVNYTTITEMQGNGFNLHNATLCTNSTQNACQDLRRALNRTDVFTNNFTIGVTVNFSGLGSIDVVEMKSTQAGADAPVLIVNWTADAPKIAFTEPTPANNTLWKNSSVRINVTTNSSLNHSAWLDFNRSLLGWWSMDFKNTTQVFDNSTYKNNLNMRGLSYGVNNFSQGIRGNSTKLDSVDDYLSILDSPNIRHGDNFSINLWFNKVGAQGSVRIANKNGTRIAWQLVVSESSVNFCVLRADSTWRNASLNLPITNNTWHHLAATYNDSQAFLYYDGRISNGSSCGVSLTNNANLTIGVSGSLFNFFNGSLDEVMYWNRTLTHDEVNATMEAGMYKIDQFYKVSNGNYSYQATTIDEAGLINATENRSLAVSLISPPQIAFVTPTPANDSITPSTIPINVSTATNYSHRTFLDFNKTLQAWINFEYANATGVFINSTYAGRFAPFNGGLVGISNITKGIFGNGINTDSFSNANKGLNISGYVPNLTGQNYTVVIWINSTTYGFVASQQIVTAYDGQSWFSIHARSLSGLLTFSVFDNKSGVTWQNRTFTPPNTNFFHQLVAVWNGTGATFYLDGNNASGTSTNIGITQRPTQAMMTLGYRPDSSVPWLNGGLDEFQFHSRAWTAAEVNASFQSLAYRYERNFTGLNTTLPYEFQACTIDEPGAINCTETRSTSISSPLVAVTLISPPNGNAFTNSRSMNFTATIITNAGTIKNATLWGNFTGPFIVNATNTTGLANGSLYQFFNIPINASAYAWNVYGCNTNDICAFAPSNFTFSMREQAPTVTLISPINGSVVVNASVLLTGTATIINTTIHNASLYFGNATNFGLSQVNITNATTVTFAVNATNGTNLWNIGFCQANALCANASANFTFILTAPLRHENEEEGIILWYVLAFFFLYLIGEKMTGENARIYKLTVYLVQYIVGLNATMALISLSNASLPINQFQTGLEMFFSIALQAGYWAFYILLVYAIAHHWNTGREIAKQKRMMD